MAFGGVEPLRIENLDKVRAQLRQIGDGAPKRLSQANKRIAELVEIRAKGKALALGGVFAKSAPSMRSGGTGKSAYVSLGGAAYPFAKGAEFGSVKYHQFRPWRGSGGDAGYFLYPTIRENQAEIREVAEQEMQTLIESI